MDFWDSLKSVGIDAAKRISTPVFGGISQAFETIVTGTQNKVASISREVVNGADPFKKATTPAQAPTSAQPSPSAQPSTAGTSTPTGSMGIVIAAALLVLVIFLMRKS